MKFNTTLDLCVKNALEQNLIPMLLGEPGIGKSSWVEALAEVMHTKCFTLACNQLADKADLTGARLVPTDDTHSDWKQVFYPHAVISDAIQYAIDNPKETPILFMDEANRTTPDVTSELLSIPTLRSIGNKKLPKNLKIIMAGNDKGNVTALDSASISRFVLLRVEPDVNTFLSLDLNLHQAVRSVLQAHPECIFAKGEIFAGKSTDNKVDDSTDDSLYIEDILDDDDGMHQMTTPRTIVGASKFLNTLAHEQIVELMGETTIIDGDEITALQEILEGYCGRTMFTRHLILELSTLVLANNASNQYVPTCPKPASYDELKACTDRTALVEFVEGLTNRERSGCLVYSLFERTNNAPYITVLAESLDKLEADDSKRLLSLHHMDALDEQNLNDFVNTGTTLGNGYALVLGQI